MGHCVEIVSVHEKISDLPNDGSILLAFVEKKEDGTPWQINNIDVDRRLFQFVGGTQNWVSA